MFFLYPCLFLWQHVLFQCRQATSNTLTNRILYFCDSLFYYSFSNPTQKVKILIIQKIKEALSPVYKSNRCECFPRIVINLIAVVKHKPRGLNVERTSQWFLFKPELAEPDLWRFWSRGLRFLHIVKMESLNHFYHCNTVFYVEAMVFYEQGDTLQLSRIWRSTKATVSQNQTCSATLLHQDIPMFKI